jgi:oligopeptide transport system substrate-binding protein
LDFLSIGGCSPELFDEVRQRHAEEYISFPSWTTVCIEFNTTSSPFDDIRVRQAFVIGTDRKELGISLGSGQHFPVTGGFVPPGVPGHTPDIALPYDPDIARQMLQKAGYPDGENFPPIKVPNFLPVYECLKNQWRENLGVEIDLDSVGKTWCNADQTHHIFASGWIADYPDPDNFLRNYLEQRTYKWQNENYDILLVHAKRSSNQEERLKLYGQLERLLVKEAPMMPHLYLWKHYLVQPWVKGFYESNPDLTLMKDVYIEPH